MKITATYEEEKDMPPHQVGDVLSDEDFRVIVTERRGKTIVFRKFTWLAPAAAQLLYTRFPRHFNRAIILPCCGVLGAHNSEDSVVKIACMAGIYRKDT